MSFVDNFFGFIKGNSRLLLQLLQLLIPFLIFVPLIFYVPSIAGFILVWIVLFSVFINFSFSNLDLSGLFATFILFLDFILVLNVWRSYLVGLFVLLASSFVIGYMLIYKRIYPERTGERELGEGKGREREYLEIVREKVELRGLELREKFLSLFYLVVFLVVVYFFAILFTVGVRFEVILFGGSFIISLVYLSEYDNFSRRLISFVLIVIFSSFVLFIVFNFSLLLKSPISGFLAFLVSLYRFSLGLFILFVGSFFYGFVLYLDDNRSLFEGADVSSILFMLFYFHWLFWVLTFVNFFAFVGLFFLFLAFLGFLASSKVSWKRLFVFEVFTSFYGFWNLFGLWLFFVFSYFLSDLFFVSFGSLIYLFVVFAVVFVLFLGLARSYNVGVSWFKRLFGVASEANTIYDRREKGGRTFRVLILAILVAFSLVLFALLLWVPKWQASWLADLRGSVLFEIFLIYFGLSVFLCIGVSYFYIFPYSVTDVFIFGEREVSDSFGLRFYKYLGMLLGSSLSGFGGYDLDKLDELLVTQVDSPDDEFVVRGVSAWGIPLSLVVFSIFSVFVWFLHVVFYVLKINGYGGIYGVLGEYGAVVALGFYILVSVLYLPWEFYRSEDLSELLFKSSFLSIIVGSSYAFLVLYWGFVLEWFSKGLLHILVYGVIGSLASVFLLVDLPARARLESLKSDELKPYIERLDSLRKRLVRGEKVDPYEISYISALISSIEGKYKVSVTPAERILASILAGGLIAFFSFLH